MHSALPFLSHGDAGGLALPAAMLLAGGAAAMAAFVAGTVPGLVATGFAGHLAAGAGGARRPLRRRP